MWPTIIRFVITQILPKVLPILLGKLKEKANSKMGIHKDQIKNETVQRIIQELNAKKVEPAKEIASTPKVVKLEPVSELHAAILKLDRNNADHWAYFGKKSQRPDLDAVEKVCGKRFTIKEVKAVWNQLK